MHVNLFLVIKLMSNEKRAPRLSCSFYCVCIQTEDIIFEKKAKESMTTFADNVNVSKLQMERAKVMLDVGSIAKSDYASLVSQYTFIYCSQKLHATGFAATQAIA